MEISESIDHKTIVLDSTTKNLSDLLFHVDEVSQNDLYINYKWGLSIDKKVFVQVLKYQEVLDRPYVRIEWNPNHISLEDSQWIYEFLKLNNWHYTRIDIAFDVFDEDLSNYYFTPKYSSSQRMLGSFDDEKYQNIFGRGKKLETLYIGKRHSPRYLRVYNKMVEQMQKPEYQRMKDENGEHIVRKHKHWWRIEFELKHKGCEKLIPDILDYYVIIDPVQIDDIRTKSMLFYLNKFPNEWSTLSPKTKNRYLQMIKKSYKTSSLKADLESSLSSIKPTLNSDL